MKTKDVQQVLLLSIIYQLLDTGVDISELNPHVQDYLHGLVDEFQSASPEEEEFYQMLYHYADTYFNSLEGKERLH